ncbi:transglycosylase SLT domain-containing protein [Evansella sp. AB-rgal1]|uniref:transglycosylase SLT domain-containing protein n=1 Tax=Evansella sp. AB-rgal1 TaxID=3242696 RepID=UPI00359D43C7
MRSKLRGWSFRNLFILISSLLVLYIFINYERSNDIPEATDLQIEKEPIKEEMQFIVEMDNLFNDIKHLGYNYYLSFDLWGRASEFSKVFSEDSDGRFQENWGRFLTIEAKRKGIDPFLVYELLKVETGGTFDPYLVGPQTVYGQAYGLAQFMENTGPWIAGMADLEYDLQFLFDPYFSIQLCIVYLDFLYKLYEDWNHALTAYHRGIYGLEEYIEENGNAESWYALEIISNAKGHELVLNN